MNGVLIVDKPAGMTSHDVVSRIRRVTGVKRVGHAGTLDPDATGVLVVCVGNATRLVEYFTGDNKRYLATLVLGIRTSTQDMSGTVLDETPTNHLSAATINEAVSRFEGDILQVPPMVSALHHNGRRLYDLARQGITVEREARPVTIVSLSASSVQVGERATVQLDVLCSKGTYIRTLCADIGDALGVGGTMGDLRRTLSGSFSLEQSVRLDQLTPNNVREFLMPSRTAISHLVGVSADSQQSADLRNGKRIHVESGDRSLVAAIDDMGELIAIGSISNLEFQPDKVFPAAS